MILRMRKRPRDPWSGLKTFRGIPDLLWTPEIKMTVTRNPKSAVEIIMYNPDPMFRIDVLVETALLALPEVRFSVRKRVLADLDISGSS
jgi:hypothetical protein